MKYESTILKRLIDTYGVVGNPRYISEIIKEFIIQGKERYPELFTYQADWLAHIDEFGLNPSYTVSYTGQSIYAPNTLERPVKSAILSGKTLVNLFNGKNPVFFNERIIYENNDILLYVPSTNVIVFNNSNKRVQIRCRNTVEQTYDYYVYINANSSHILNPIYNIGQVQGYLADGWANTDESKKELRESILIIEYQEGMENWDIPYFEGMSSVKMPVLTATGKNLFDMNNTHFVSGLIHNANLTINATANTNVYYIPCEPNTSYTITKGLTSYFRICETTDVPTIGCKVSNLVNNPSKTSLSITTSDSAKYLCFNIHNTSTDTVSENEILGTVQIEKGSTSTSYEPFKSNILTVNDDVTLRGIGDVKDELDLLTGEVVERIGEVVFDGSTDEFWELQSINSYGIANFRTSVNAKDFSDLICVQLPMSSEAIADTSTENIMMTQNKALYIRKKATVVSTVSELQQFLASNPITVQYQLKTESVKTVVLTILDQNGQNVKQLMSFNGGTHFNTGSLEGSLPPSVSVCVETDLEETLKVCSLEGNTM